MKTNHLAENYGSLSQAIQALGVLGYTHNFNASAEHVLWEQANHVLQPDNLQIDRIYRFETAANPEDQAILYAISAIQSNFKGTMVNGIGQLADPHTCKMVDGLPLKKVYAWPKSKTAASNTSKRKGTFEFAGALQGLDLPAAVKRLKKENKWATGNLDAITLFESDSLRIVLMGLQANAILRSLKASCATSVQLLQGKINFITDSKQMILEKEQLFLLTAGATYNVVALDESFVLVSMALQKTVAAKKPHTLTKIAL